MKTDKEVLKMPGILNRETPRKLHTETDTNTFSCTAALYSGKSNIPQTLIGIHVPLSPVRPL